MLVHQRVPLQHGDFPLCQFTRGYPVSWNTWKLRRKTEKWPLSVGLGQMNVGEKNRFGTRGTLKPITAWWFGICFLTFPSYWEWNHHPNWRNTDEFIYIFQKGRYTTNQVIYIDIFWGWIGAMISLGGMFWINPWKPGMMLVEDLWRIGTDSDHFTIENMVSWKNHHLTINIHKLGHLYHRVYNSYVKCLVPELTREIQRVIYVNCQQRL